MLGSMTIAQAITTMENTPASLNNPGALTAPLGYCSTGKTGILVNFCTPEDGAAALQQQINYLTNKGLNLYEFFGGKQGVYPGYAPAGHGKNDPTVYAGFVAANTGIDPNIPLNQTGLYGPTESYTPVQADGTYGYGDLASETLQNTLDANGIDLGTLGLGALALGALVLIWVKG